MDNVSYTFKWNWKAYLMWLSSYSYLQAICKTFLQFYMMRAVVSVD